MRYLLIAILSASAALSAPVAAQQSDRPMMDRDPTAVDVAKTPVTDLNIDKQEIPELLLAAQHQPYDLSGLGKCTELIAAVEELDAILGPDLDIPQKERDRISEGRLARTVVGSFIPFRGIIREISGANEHARQVRVAIQAGLARRGFLKGVGQARNCDYPARPASRELIAARLAELEGDEKDATDANGVGADPAGPPLSERGVRFESQPVVQKTR